MMSFARTPVSTNPIGVFDSGVGGLSVLDMLAKVLPGERFVYLGDTLHMPYGERSEEEIRRLATGIVQYFVETHHVKMIVVACNTSAGVLADFWQSGCPVPAVEPAWPVSQWLVGQPYRKIGLLATQTTVKSGRYPALIRQGNPAIEVQSVSCVGFARLVEDNRMHTPEGRALVRGFLEPLAAWGAEAVILGCTHYPFARSVIEECWRSIAPDKSLMLLDPAHWMGERAKTLLQERRLLNEKTTQPMAEITYWVTGNPAAFDQTAQALNLAHINPRPATQVVSDAIPLQV